MTDGAASVSADGALYLGDAAASGDPLEAVVVEGDVGRAQINAESLVGGTTESAAGTAGTGDPSYARETSDDAPSEEDAEGALVQMAR